MMLSRALALFVLAALAVLGTAAPVFAGAGGSGLLFAGYWHEFLEHWTGVFQKQNGIVMAVLVIGAVCLFIITRGKWRKS
jgi:hypothetical protein